MEALTFLRLWQPIPTTTSTMPNDLAEEEEDSFIELELTVPDRSILCSKQNQSNFFHSTPSPSKGESFSKRKILPIESLGRPQSPISLLKSAPKIGASMFRKSKSVSSSNKTESENRGADSSTLKFKMKDLEPTLIRDFSNNSVVGQSNSKWFAKDVIQKYLKLVTPERKETQGKPPAGNRSVPRQLGKSKSTSAAAAAFSSPARRDDSLAEQHDGIQSAILHCKQSFNSCRDSLSRSREKPSEDSAKILKQAEHR